MARKQKHPIARLRKGKHNYVAFCGACSEAFVCKPDSFGGMLTCPHCDRTNIVPHEDGTPSSLEDATLHQLNEIGEALMEPVSDEDDVDRAVRELNEQMANAEDILQAKFDEIDDAFKNW